MKDLTQKELKWVMRLEKFLDTMPIGLCILVNHGGSLVVTRSFEIERCFKDKGYALDPESLYEILTSGDIRPNSESL